MKSTESDEYLYCIFGLNGFLIFMDLIVHDQNIAYVIKFIKFIYFRLKNGLTEIKA